MSDEDFHVFLIAAIYICGWWIARAIRSLKK